ncbi:protein NLRC3-like isoform X2 [Halichoeres trimaculatus]|uniref:protein NLRC3-like isoform X2 n=1 Tax=Halichoeres trimaculatus TaxID=147232 RepID=UPI003D9E0C5D
MDQQTSHLNPAPKSLSGNEKEIGNTEEFHQVLCRKQDEFKLGPKEAVDNTGSISSVHSTVSQFNPDYSAKEGANVVAPLFNGSNVGVINININPTSQGSGNHDASSQPKDKKIAECQQKLRDTLKRKFSYLLQVGPGMKKAPLNSVYTELRIIKGGNGEVYKEHEVRQMETDVTDMTEEESIHCNHLFKGQDLHIRTVITRGVGDIGKTVSTNKFTLDWAEKKENDNLDFVFPVPFQDLNKMREKAISLAELLTTLFPDTKDSEIFTLGEHKMLFIFDGLNESRLSLDFDSEIVTDVKQPTTVANLLINIIRGRLLPSALVWITTRPETFERIPGEYVDLVIEVRGFTNPQTDEYFRKTVPTQHGIPDRVISQLKSCKSLYIMCHIPGFCWMLASDLGKKLAKVHGKDTPLTLTLTPMYIAFLTSCVANMMKKLPGSRSTPECVKSDIVSLGKLAFEKLNENLSIFYESDLSENLVQDTEPSMLSGLYTQIFSEELILFQEKMFSFVHLSVQEFFAALYVYLMFINNNINVLINKLSGAKLDDKPELNLFTAAVEKALQCQNGHFDIFLRFLLGLSLDSNQKPLKFLMTSNRTNPKTRDEIIEHIKEKIRVSPPSDRHCNLIHCLKELGDHSMVEGN